MLRAISGTVVMILLLSAGASAQGHAHGSQGQAGTAPPPTDSIQGAAEQAMPQMHQHMQSMEQRMQAMEQRMQAMEQHRESMHQMMQSGAPDGGMQGMRQGQENGGAMQGMAGQSPRSQSQSCLASGPQAGLSALLMGPAGGLSLTDAQVSALERILARAQSEALEALTPEQRLQLASAPAGAADCRRVPQSAGGTAGS